MQLRSLGQKRYKRIWLFLIGFFLSFGPTRALFGHFEELRNKIPRTGVTNEFSTGNPLATNGNFFVDLFNRMFCLLKIPPKGGRCMEPAYGGAIWGISRICEHGNYQILSRVLNQRTPQGIQQPSGAKHRFKAIFYSLSFLLLNSLTNLKIFGILTCWRWPFLHPELCHKLECSSPWRNPYPATSPLRKQWWAWLSQ